MKVLSDHFGKLGTGEVNLEIHQVAKSFTNQAVMTETLQESKKQVICSEASTNNQTLNVSKSKCGETYKS